MILFAGTPPAGLKQASAMWTTVARAPLAEREGRGGGDHDYEGLIAKEESSLYEAGPTRRWLKVKQRGWTVEEDRWQRRISARAAR